ncbi:MAG TPA: hypothetical protein VF546_23145 [Pyrinomonadaceae bacterium]|jgi:hypothetical protein
MSWVSVVILLLLLVVAGELAFVIYWGWRRLARWPDQLHQALAPALALAQKQWADDFKQLADKLAAGRAADTKPPPLPAAGAAQGEAYDKLLTAAQKLSASAEQLRPAPAAPSEDADARVRVLAERFDAIAQQWNTVLRNGFNQMAKERSQLLTDLMAKASEHQVQVLDALRRLEAALRELPQLMPQPPRTVKPAAEPAPAAPVAERAALAPPEPMPPAPDGDAPPPQDARAEAAPAITPAAGASFEPLQDWVTTHLDQIMNRSLNQWSEPEDLLRDAPAELGYTAKLHDADAKLVLIGLKGETQYLALALPGGQLDSTYTDWFSTPAAGGGRVARTVSPAHLAAGATGYRVLRRGVIQ